MEDRGFYNKFCVARADGQSAPGGKHEHCTYFVLDVYCDPHASPALAAYAESCRENYPALAADIDQMLTASNQRKVVADRTIERLARMADTLGTEPLQIDPEKYM